MRTCVIACLLLLGAGAALAAGGEPVTLKQFAEAARDRLGGECDVAKAEAKKLPENPTDRLRMKNAASQYLSCDCMPEKLTALAASDGADASVTQDQAMDKIKPLMNACGALAMRKFLKPMCEQSNELGPGIQDVNGFCGCLVSGLDKFTDEQITEDAVAAYRSSLARAKALQEGKPAPAPHVLVIASVEKDCRAKYSRAP
jgi:hypothetical protein